MAVRIERLIRIYNRLQRGPVTIEIISQWAKNAGIKVSDRQLYRDLNELRSLSIAKGENVVEYINEKNKKTWKLEYDDNQEKLTQFDINSFFLLKNFAPYSVFEQRKHSIEKFEQIIYRQVSTNKYQQSIKANELYLRRTNYNENLYGQVEHQQIEDLIWALQNHRIIVIEEEVINCANIHLSQNPFPLSMYPLELVFHRGRVHIAGLSVTTNQFLLFAIDKGLKFTLTNRAFERSQFLSFYHEVFARIFGISDPPNNKIYTVKIEFTKGFGESWMNHFWHHSQQWKPLKNGNIMLQMQCSIGRELVGFIAHGLDKMKVHQPRILKNLVWQKLKDTVAVYENNLEIREEESNKGY